MASEQKKYGRGCLIILAVDLAVGGLGWLLKTVL